MKEITEGGGKVHKYLHWNVLQCEAQFDMQIQVRDLSDHMQILQQTIHRKDFTVHALGPWGSQK